MGDWANLPSELLADVFSHLPRRDRLSCILVCVKWRLGLDHVRLWRSLVVHIDTDLMEPSTLVLFRHYCKYLRCLEFGWAAPHRPNRWLPLKYKELTKRAVRFLSILFASLVQIRTLRIFNWFDFMSFHKVTYHLARFLKTQSGIREIVFDNINMHSRNFLRIMTSCLGSRSTITSLDIRSCYYVQSTFDSVYFRTCIEQLTYLKHFKLDYFVLSCKMIEAILTSKNSVLQTLELVLKQESSCHDLMLSNDQWCLLTCACPKLKVSLVIKNIYSHEEMCHYLRESMPLASLTMVVPNPISSDLECCLFAKTLNLLVNFYNQTLEIIDLHLRNDRENLDDVLLMIIRRCTRLKSLAFNGLLRNPEIIQNAFKSDIYMFGSCPDSQGMVRVQFNLHKTRFMGKIKCTLLFLNC